VTSSDTSIEEERAGTVGFSRSTHPAGAAETELRFDSFRMCGYPAAAAT
jgi:hypothetical protein